MTYAFFNGLLEEDQEYWGPRIAKFEKIRDHCQRLSPHLGKFFDYCIDKGVWPRLMGMVPFFEYTETYDGKTIYFFYEEYCGDVDGWLPTPDSKAVLGCLEPDEYGIYPFEYLYNKECCIVNPFRAMYVTAVEALAKSSTLYQYDHVNFYMYFPEQDEPCFRKTKMAKVIECGLQTMQYIKKFDPYDIMEMTPSCPCQLHNYRYFDVEMRMMAHNAVEGLEDCKLFTESYPSFWNVSMDEEGQSQSDPGLVPNPNKRNTMVYVRPVKGRKPGERPNVNKTVRDSNAKFRNKRYRDENLCHGIKPSSRKLLPSELRRCKELFPKVCLGDFNLTNLRLSYYRFNALMYKMGWFNKNIDWAKAERCYKSVMSGKQIPNWNSREISKKPAKYSSIRVFLKNYSFFLGVFTDTERNILSNYVDYCQGDRRTHKLERLAPRFVASGDDCYVSFEKKQFVDMPDEEIPDIEDLGDTLQIGESQGISDLFNVKKRVKENVGEMASAAIKAAAWDFIYSIPKKIMDLFYGVKGSIESMLEKVRSSFIKLFQWVKEKFANMMKATSSYLEGLTPGVLLAWTVLIFGIVISMCKGSWPSVVMIVVGFLLIEVCRANGRTPAPRAWEIIYELSDSTGSGVGTSQAGGYLLGETFAMVVAILGLANSATRLVDVVPRVFHTIKDGMIYYFDCLYYAIMKEHLVVSRTEVDDLDVYLKKIQVFFSDPTIPSTYLKEPAKGRVLKELGSQVKRFETLLLKTKTHPQYGFWMASIEKIKHMYTTLIQTSGTHDSRIETPLLWLHGPPGEGKTFIIPKVMRAVYQCVQKAYPDLFPDEWDSAQMFVRAKNSDYWDTYQQQFGVLFNELGAARDATERYRELSEVMSACESGVYSLNTAHIDGKGCTLFNSFLACVTSNLTTEDLKSRCGLSEPGAIKRRQTIYAEVLRNADLEDDYSNLDDAWKFVTSYEPENDASIKKGVHPLLYKWMKEAHKTGSNVILTFSQVVVLISDTIIERIKKMKSAADSDKAFNFADYCREKTQLDDTFAPVLIKKSMNNNEIKAYFIPKEEGTSHGFTDEIIPLIKVADYPEWSDYLAVVTRYRELYNKFIPDAAPAGHMVRKLMMEDHETFLEYLDRLDHAYQLDPSKGESIGEQAEEFADDIDHDKQTENDIFYHAPEEVVSSVEVVIKSKVGTHRKSWLHYAFDKIWGTSQVRKTWMDWNEKWEYTKSVFTDNDDISITPEHLRSLGDALRTANHKEMDMLCINHIRPFIQAKIACHEYIGNWNFPAMFQCKLAFALYDGDYAVRREAIRFMRHMVVYKKELFKYLNHDQSEIRPGNEELYYRLVDEIESHIWLKKNGLRGNKPVLDKEGYDTANWSFFKWFDLCTNELLPAVTFYPHPVLDAWMSAMFGSDSEVRRSMMIARRIPPDQEYSCVSSFFNISAWNSTRSYDQDISKYIAYIDAVYSSKSRKDDKWYMWSVKAKKNLETFKACFADYFYYCAFIGCITLVSFCVGFGLTLLARKFMITSTELGVSEEIEMEKEEEEPWAPKRTSQSLHKKSHPKMPKHTRVAIKGNSGLQKVGQSQSSTSNDVFIRSCNAIANNIRTLYVVYSSGCARQCKMLMSGRIGFIPGHHIDAWGTDITEFIIANGDVPQHRFSFDRVKLVSCPGRDTYEVIFPQEFSPLKSLSKYMLHKDDLDDRADNESYDVFRLHKFFAKEASSIYIQPGARVLKHESRTFSLNLGDSKHMTKVYGVYSLAGAFGESGDCMLPYISRENSSGEIKILGLHIGRIGEDSYFTPCYKEDVGQSQSAYIPDCVDNLLPPEHRNYEGRMTSMGAAKKVVHIPDKTVYVETPFGLGARDGVPYKEVTSAPAILRVCTYKGKELQPLKMGMAKMVSPPIRSFPNWILELGEKFPEVLYFGFFPVKKRQFRMFTIEEAIFGVQGFFDGLDSSTSVGYDMQVLGYKSRTELWNKDTKWINPVLMEAVEKLIKAAKAGDIPKNVVSACLKDELRDLDRVRAGKTRVFCVGSLAHLIFTVMIMGDIVTYMKANRSTSDVAIGINPHGVEWTMLYKKLTSIPGCKFGGGDFSGFDSSIVSEIAYLLGKAFLWYSGARGVHAQLIMAACMSSVAAIMVVGDTVYDMDWMNSSGGWLTGVLNSFANVVIFNSFWYKLQGEHPDLFEDKTVAQHMRRVFYGDDNLWAIHDSLSGVFTMQALSKYIYETFGMTYTTPDKSDVTTPFLELDDLEFLCRKFRKEGSVVFAPLSRDSICGMLHWVRKPSAKTGLTLRTQLEQNIEVASMEYFHYGKAVYDVETELLKDFCDKTYHSFTGLPFLSYKERYVQTFSA